ncbi:MAG: MBL fold metallo-hydrolase, partial [Gemmatimonadota bacterium]
DRAFAEGETLTFAGESFSVWHLPGPSPGHVALISATRIFGGDLLFQGSVGRTDLPRSEPAAMAASLERLMTLPDHLIVHPGHGPATTIGAERASNPFLTGAARIPRS